MSYKVAMVQFCLFIKQFRLQIYDQDYVDVADPLSRTGDGVWAIESSTTQTMFVALYVNGSEIEGARMRLPITVHIEKQIPNGVGRTYSLRTVYENVRAQEHSGGVLLQDNGAGNVIYQGLNTVEFKLRMERPAGAYEKSIIWKAGSSSEFAAEVEFRQRITFGNGTIVFIPFDGHGR